MEDIAYLIQAVDHDLLRLHFNYLSKKVHLRYYPSLWDILDNGLEVYVGRRKMQIMEGHQQEIKVNKMTKHQKEQFEWDFMV